MTTRGIIAVVEDGSWKGFEIKTDANPEGAGAKLFGLLREHGYEKTCDLIRSARLFIGVRDKADARTHGNRGDLSWTYFIDHATRTLRVFYNGARTTPNAPTLDGAWAEVAVHQIELDGTCTPPTLEVKLPMPWPLLHVDETWSTVEGTVDAARGESDADSAATARLETRRRIARECAANGITVERFSELAGEIVLDTFFRAPWKAPVARAYVHREWTSGSKYWRLHVGECDLLYPPAGWGRTGAITRDGSTREELSLFAEGVGDTTLDVQRSALVKGRKDGAAMRAVIDAALTGPDWLFQLLDVVRTTTIPDPRGEELERMRQSPQEASDWQVLKHPDGRVWSIRPAKDGYQLRLGAADDDPVFKERRAARDQIEALITEQIADGFQRA